MSGADSYDRDFVQWAEENAELLRAGRFEEADIDHIAEEIEDMGKSRRHALTSRLRVLTAHLLKHQTQAARRGASWRSTIVTQRLEIAELLEENPSLRNELEALAARAYPKAVVQASKETGLPAGDFPRNCPYSIAQLLDEDYLPE